MNRLAKNHPARWLLETAATGVEPPSDRLDDLKAISDSLPDGHDLARFRSRLVTNCREVAALAETGDFIAARRRADHHAGLLASAMTAHEASLTSADVDPEDLGDIADRMFGSY